MKSTALLSQYLEPLQITFLNLLYFMIHRSPVEIVHGLFYERATCAITWEAIWVCNELISVNTRNKEVEIKHF